MHWIREIIQNAAMMCIQKNWGVFLAIPSIKIQRLNIEEKGNSECIDILFNELQKSVIYN